MCIKYLSVILAPINTNIMKVKLEMAILMLPLSIWPEAQPLAILAPNETRNAPKKLPNGPNLRLSL